MADNIQEGKSKGSVVIIVLLVAVIGGLGYFLFMKQKENDQLSKDKANTETQLAEAELSTRVSELEELQIQYEELQAQNEAMGIESEELTERISELKKQVISLKSKKRLSVNENRALKKQIAGFKADLLKKDQEIQALRLEKDSLIANNDSLRNEKLAMEAEMGDSISTLNKKVAIASVLEAEGIKASVIYTNGKEYEKNSYRAKKIDRFKLGFNLAENNIAKHDKKELCLKVIDPSGSVLFNLEEGSGSFTKNDGTNEIYTAHQFLNFDNTKQDVSFIYKAHNYVEGEYKLEVFADGYFIGMTKILLK